MLLTGCFAPSSEFALNQSGIRPNARANERLKVGVPLIPLQLDPPTPASVGEVKDNIGKKPPRRIRCSCPRYGGRPRINHWPTCPNYRREPSGVSEDASVAIHEREDGQRCTIQIAQEICPHERTC